MLWCGHLEFVRVSLSESDSGAHSTHLPIPLPYSTPVRWAGPTTFGWTTNAWESIVRCAWSLSEAASLLPPERLVRLWNDALQWKRIRGER